MIPMQRAEIARALADLLILKGSVGLSIDEMLIPTVAAADLTQTPYLRYSVLCGRSQTLTGVAATFGYCVFRPGPNRILQIRRIIIRNPDAAAHQFTLRLGTAAFVAQLDTPSASVRLIDFTTDIANTPVSSTTFSATDAAGTDTGSTSILSLDVPAASSVNLEIESPGIALFGNDPGGLPALAVKCADVNITFGASVQAKEWPLPGV